MSVNSFEMKNTYFFERSEKHVSRNFHEKTCCVGNDRTIEKRVQCRLYLPIFCGPSLCEEAKLRDLDRASLSL